MATKSRLSDDQWADTYARALAGERICDLAEEFQFSAGGLSLGLKRRFGSQFKRRAMTRVESDAAYARAIAGESLASIARSLGPGYNKANLYRLLQRRYGYVPKNIRTRAVWEQTVTLSDTSDTELAYIAGIIDGEGSIMKIHRNRRHPVWAVKVNMTDRPLIEWLHSLGGTFSVRPSRDPGRLKEQYEWKIHRQLDVQTFLTAVRPYLRVKAHLADQALSEFAGDLRMICERTPPATAHPSRP